MTWCFSNHQFFIYKKQAIPLPLFFIYKNDMVLLKPLFLLCKNDRAMLGTKSADDTSNEKEVRNIKQKQRPKRNAFGNNVFTSYDAKTK